MSPPWPWGDVTSWVTWPHGSLYSTSCRCFIGSDRNLKSIAFTILELLALNAPKFTGSRDPGHAPYEKIMRVLLCLSLRAYVPNLKFASLSILQLLAFNPEKFTGGGGLDSGHDPFSNIFTRSCRDANDLGVTLPWPRPLFEKISQGSCWECPWEYEFQIWSLYLYPFWNY